MMFPKSKPWRSPRHRRLVASLPCAACSIVGYSQAAHPNAGKGLGTKTSDILTFPLCCDRPGVRGCHSLHDQGGKVSREERTALELKYIEKTRASMIWHEWWPAEAEAEYQAAIQPLVRVVHGEAA
ncbi:hypothetical protein [Castellaniella ginsengisoli]|uniref:DUF968 domain-containing protein n=1 Tax=Castellaniella ginsengisoli TaxID=546114 RepID=A0AB39CTB8_9BURK